MACCLISDLPCQNEFPEFLKAKWHNINLNKQGDLDLHFVHHGLLNLLLGRHWYASPIRYCSDYARFGRLAVYLHYHRVQTVDVSAFYKS